MMSCLIIVRIRVWSLKLESMCRYLISSSLYETIFILSGSIVEIHLL